MTREELKKTTLADLREIANNLKSGFGYKKELIEEILIKNNIPLTIRTEALSVEQIVHLSNEFYLAQNK